MIDESHSDEYSSVACHFDQKPYAGTIILNVMISSQLDLIIFILLTLLEILILYYQIYQVWKYVQKFGDAQNIDKTLVQINLFNLIISYMYIFTFTFYISAFLFKTDQWNQFIQNFPFVALQITESFQLFLIFIFYQDQYKNEYGNQNSKFISLLIITNIILLFGSCISCIPALVINFCLGSIQIMNYFKLAQCGVSIAQNIYFFYKEYKAKSKFEGYKNIIMKKIIYLLFILLGLFSLITFYIVRVLNNYTAFYIKFEFDEEFPPNIGLLSNFKNIQSPLEIKNNFIWPIIFPIYIISSSILPRILIIQINTSSTTKSENFSMQKIES
ncbi:hypothetical protein pb186bvf_007615 [Paramecium bursaria]